MNWMWTWPETVAATNDMFITVLKLMEEFPEFCFSQSQASVYEITREYNPALFSKIKSRIAEGRWEVTASEWVEGDKNLPSGESLVRHLLYTRRYMAENFGLKPEDVSISWNPDTFGHACTIPMIYTRGGVSRYYMCRGGETPKPPIFWWQGADGSRLLVNLEHTWYNDVIGPHNIKGLLSFCEKTGLNDWMLVYGVGDHGGGPTRRDLHMCIEMNSWPIYPNFKFSTTRKYYEILEKHSQKFPVVNGELNYEFTGCYTSQSDIKKTNRLSECLLERAEFAASLANVILGASYPNEVLRNAWQATLFGHFHDILPGSGIKTTREYHSGQFQNTAAATGMIITNSLRAIAGDIDTSFAGESEAIKDDVHFGAGMGLGGNVNIGGISTACHVSGVKRGFVVFNPTAIRRSEVIKLTAWDAEHDSVHTKKFVVRTSDGNEIPAQRLYSSTLWGHNYVELAVPVTVSAMGYSAFVLDTIGENEPVVENSQGYQRLQKEEVGLAKNFAFPRPLREYFAGDWGMENEFIRVAFDKTTGGITELVDKTTGVNLVAAGSQTAILEYFLEQPGSMSAWLMRPARKSVCPIETISFQPAKFGPHLTAYEGVYKINDSTIKMTYSLSAGSPRVDINVEVDWLERGGPQIGTPALRMQFPFALENTMGRYEIPFGSIERKPQAGQEVPSQKFVDVT
ncbi:MAG TPA: glycoside hydrolase family 38 C-terminal domain-containing protein, partial [Phycisphaerae bacterium]|nr:glycoside hydrolase family 38 C-terminal domain-containing protein [Phycisphaerae bacterium]